MPGEVRFDVAGAWRADATVRIDLFGDPDDHVRAAAEFARQAAGTLAAAALAPCLDPSTSWHDRLDALHEGLPKLSRVEVRDPDALLGPTVIADDEPPPIWDDHRDLRARRVLLDVLVDTLARRADWTFVRTSRDIRLNRPLQDRGIRIRPAEPGRPLDELQMALNELDPVCRPMARTLVSEGVFTARDVQRMVDAGGADAGLDLAATSVDTVLPRQRTLLRQLAAVRIEQVVNGQVEPFPSSSPRRDPWTVDRGDFDRLVSRGLVVQDVGRWRVPRPVREQLVPQARALDEDGTRGLHRMLVDAVTAPTERHHHAVEAEDLALAVATLPGYATHLKSLAYTWSRRAATARPPERHALFLAAAGAYRTVVEHDPDDAYAWEYLAFNLVRAQESESSRGGGTGAGDGLGGGYGGGAGSGAGYGDGSGWGGGDPEPGRHAEEVDRAYTQACVLEPDNPLYRGRWLAWRPRADLVSAFGWWLGTFDGLLGMDGAQWFADPVLRAVLRRRDRTTLSQLREQYGPTLNRSARLRELMAR